MKIMVVAPHPDDETLGLGGSILKFKHLGYEIAWTIMSEISVDNGWSMEKVRSREYEIGEIEKFYNFDKTYRLGLKSAELDSYPMKELVSKVSLVIDDFKPQKIFLADKYDVHTDHKITFNSIMASCKWFRCPSIKSILTYETLSETNFTTYADKVFKPNYFEDISEFIEGKKQAMKIYKDEIQNHPFPRSIEAIRALAVIRGSESGFNYAESFKIIFSKNA